MMVARINRLIVIFIVVGLALYLVLLNRDIIPLRIAPQYEISAPAGIIFIAIFGLGILAAGVVGLFFGLKSFFREKKLQAKVNERVSFHEGMLNARSLFAVGGWNRAKDAWEKLIRRDPTNIIARVELSRCLEALGDTRSALKVIDEARVKDPTNTEVLFRAAELNLGLGNRTAAIDNLALILSEMPNWKAAQMARDLSEELGRIDDAIEYQEKLSELKKPTTLNNTDTSTRLEFKKILKTYDEDEKKLISELKSFVKKNSDFVPALSKLASFELQNGNRDEAARNLMQAGKVSESLQFWNEAARTWIDGDMPDKAIAAVRSAARDTSGNKRLEAELILIQLYLSLNMITEADKHISEFPALADQENTDIESSIGERLRVLKALSRSTTGKHEETREILRAMASGNPGFENISNGTNPDQDKEAPAPRLSTP